MVINKDNLARQTTAPSLRERVILLALNGALFGVTYTLTNLAAQQADITRNVAMAWETGLPFVPWMIVPYMTSCLLFVLSFLLARDRVALTALSQRIACATVTGCAIFAAWPLRFATSRPDVDAALPAWLYTQLAAMDQPYNQLPSLHVAYCMIFWPALRAALPGATARAALAAWLLLVAASTVFTWQHHLLDVAGGALLGAMTLRLLPAQNQVAAAYALLAGLALLAWQLAGGMWWLYLCASLLLVAGAYHRDNPAFLRKRGGGYPWWIWLAYAPYLLGYRLTWLLVRWRERHRPPFTQTSAGLWAGRRLTVAEAAHLPQGCAIIDLANELNETPTLRRHDYHHFPLLDLHTPTAQMAAPILATIHGYLSQGRTVYLHCAMGYRRSRQIAHLYSEYRPQ
jgi:membrane-associated phospholipid phosphatase/rhodanese-related sulfurtransferase